MVEAYSSPRSPCTLRSPSSSSASAEAAAALAALVAAAEQLSDESEAEEHLWSAPEVHELPQLNGFGRGVAKPMPEQLDKMQGHPQQASQASALATVLRRAALPQPQAAEIEVDNEIKPYSGTASCSQGASAAASRALYRCDPVGRRMRNSKLRHVWMLRFTGVPQDTKVELLHSRLTGKKQVLVDGKVMYSSRQKCLNWYWEHPVSHARVSLRSENGNHQLLCEEPKQEPALIDTGDSSTMQEPVSTERPYPPRSLSICQSPTLGSPRSLHGSPRSPAPMTSPQSLWLVPAASDDAVSATICHTNDGHNAVASTCASPGVAYSETQSLATVTSAHEHVSTSVTPTLPTPNQQLAAIQADGSVDSSGATSVSLKRCSYPRIVIPAAPVDDCLPLSTSEDGHAKLVEPLVEHTQAAPIGETTRDAPMNDLLHHALELQPPVMIEDMQSTAVIATGNTEKKEGSADVMSDGLAAQDEENRRLQELIEQRDAQIASLQGQLRQQHDLGSDTYPSGGHSWVADHHVAVIPPAPTALPAARTALPAAPSAAPSDSALADKPEIVQVAGETAEWPEHSALDDEELDVTRRLGPVRRLPDAIPAQIRAVSVQAGCGRAAGTADVSRCRPVEVKVEVKARPLSAGATRGRAVSTPPVVQHFRPQSAQPENNQQSNRPVPPSAIPSSHAQTPAHYRQVMTPRRLVPVPVQQQPPAIKGGVGQLRSATPGPSRDRHSSIAGGSRPSATAVTPAPCFAGRPPGFSSLDSPTERDNATALQRTPRAASTNATPRATSTGPLHGRRPAAGPAFGSMSLAQPPGISMPGGPVGFAAASLAAATATASGSCKEHVESTPRCLRLPPAPALAPPAGWNGISPCAASRHQYGTIPGRHGGVSIGQMMASGFSSDSGMSSLNAFGPAGGLQGFQPNVVLCPMAQ